MNPYEPSPVSSELVPNDKLVHPDWKWMTLMVYGFCYLCMLSAQAKTNRIVSGSGEPTPLGYISGHELFGSVGFYLAGPVLAAIPAGLLCLIFRPFYRCASPSVDKIANNFLFLFCGLVAGLVNASLYHGV